MRRRRGEKVLRSVRPNVGIEAAYRRALTNLIGAMGEDVQECVRRSSEIAQDAGLADTLRVAMHDLVNRWGWKFEEVSSRLAQYFGTATCSRVDSTLRKILHDGGISVEFRPTQAQQDVLDATVDQNVSLIKSIPQRYLGEVAGLVMRSVQVGRDLGTLSRDLRALTGVTKKRAALVARDQNNKATAAMVRVRQVEAGIEQAIWMHSGAGKEPRPTHVAMSGKKFSVSGGMFDSAEGRRVMPGELINCRCSSRPVIHGLV